LIADSSSSSTGKDSEEEQDPEMYILNMMKDFKQELERTIKNPPVA